jgi:hypothetical protein
VIGEWGAGRPRASAVSALRPGLLTLVTVLGAGSALAVETGVFMGPGMEGFVRIQEYQGDGNADGADETTIRRFKNVAGDRMFTMTARDHLWAWSVDAVGDDDSDLNRNYVLRDSDCDGRFDERYRLDEGFSLPECLN